MHQISGKFIGYYLKGVFSDVYEYLVSSFAATFWLKIETLIRIIKKQQKHTGTGKTLAKHG